jgi:hypothetical protein
MVASVAERNQNRGKRGGATTGLKQKLGRARRIVHVLDAFIQTALKDDQVLLSSWNIVKRVRRNTNRPATPATPPVVPPVTPPVTPSATPPVAPPATPSSTPPADAPAP